MKVVFLGAGQGSRLQDITCGRPKWLLEMAGQSILQHSVNVMHQCGVVDTLIIRGALEGRIRSPSVAYLDAPNTSNMVETLFSARSHLDGDVIVSYCDIIYEPKIVLALLESNADIGVIVDRSWRSLFAFRSDNVLSIAESCEIHGQDLISIGQPLAPNEEPSAQYIGLMRFSSSGIRVAAELYDKLAKSKAGQPWRNAKSFEKAYMTDFLQELIDGGHKVSAICVDGGWLEFDTWRDYTFACEIVQSNQYRDIFDFSMMPPYPSVISAGGVAIRNDGDRREVLLVGSGRDGEWRIPKGMLEAGEAVEIAATREVMEETGVKVKVLALIGTLNWTYKYADVDWTERCIFFKMQPVSFIDPVPDSEHEVAAWLPIDRAKAGLMYDNEREILLRSLEQKS